MRLLKHFLVLLLADRSLAWAPLVSNTKSRMRQRSHALRMGDQMDLHEFDYLLKEGGQSLPFESRSRRAVQLESTQQSQNPSAVLLTSAATFPSPEQVAESAAEQMGESSVEGAEVGGGEYDPYGDVDSQMGMQLKQYQEQKPTLESRLKSMDLQDIIITLIVPGIITFAGVRWGYNRVAERLEEKADTTLESFASELIYHDGNFEEMKMCHADYARQLMWLGPRKSETMIKRFLAAYAKKKTVSPQSISSLSYVFTLFKLSEERAAQILVSLCREMGTDKISSAGKLLFFGSRILKSPEGKASLIPIKDMIKSTYRDEEVAETLVETSQQAIAEAAYRTTVQNGGKNQKSLTVGWEVLGLDKTAATRIFEDEAKEGFITAREQMYGGQTTKYDKHGNVLDDSGNLKDPENAITSDDKETEEVSNVYTCSECGYTLFIAQGREFKFYGEDFKCPECGATKDKFKAGLDDDDE